MNPINPQVAHFANIRFVIIGEFPVNILTNTLEVRNQPFAQDGALPSSGALPCDHRRRRRTELVRLGLDPDVSLCPGHLVGDDPRACWRTPFIGANVRNEGGWIRNLPNIGAAHALLPHLVAPISLCSFCSAWKAPPVSPQKPVGSARPNVGDEQIRSWHRPPTPVLSGARTTRVFARVGRGAPVEILPSMDPSRV